MKEITEQLLLNAGFEDKGVNGFCKVLLPSSVESDGLALSYLDGKVYLTDPEQKLFRSLVSDGILSALTSEELIIKE